MRRTTISSCRGVGLGLFTLIGGLSVAVGHSRAETNWWPLQVNSFDGDKVQVVDYVPLEKASKKWNLCVLFPHMKDSVWVGFDYGIVKEAERLGVAVTIFEAGGYTELNKQLSQYDDCVALHPDAILFAAISEGIAQKVQEGLAKGIAQIAVVNPVSDKVKYDAQVFSDTGAMGLYAAKWLAERHAKSDRELTAVTFPGPPGAGWAEAAAKGMRDGLAGSKIKIVGEKYGDTGKSAQLKLVEDALQQFPNLDILFCNGVTAEVAPAAVDEAGLRGKVEVAGWYVNDGSLRNIRSGDVGAAAMQITVPMTRIGVDMAVRVLEKKDHFKRVAPIPQMLTKDNITPDKIGLEFAPPDWKPVYSVK